jgi:drug/metabolite transporter (DMT)-like permease
VIALIAIFFLSWQNPDDTNVKGTAWLLLAVLVFICWAVQGFYLKVANNAMRAESIFFYMALSGLLLAPFAWMMTDFSSPVNWGFNGPYLAALIHILNSAGALMLVYAFRYGKAIIVAPLTGLAPVLTVIISLVVYGVVPGIMLAIGIVLAATAMWLLAE